MTRDHHPKDREQRRRNHIAKDLRTPKYKQRVVEVRTVEDEERRRARRYGWWDYNDAGE